jgi:diguanylate cyclase (GGDEF)-like protein
MITCYALEPTELERFLERQQSSITLRSVIDLGELLKNILEKAYEFVPSESGSILLDDPTLKVPARGSNELVFIATFGRGSETLLGQRLTAGSGIAGKVYETGAPYLSPDVARDRHFFSKIDEQLNYKSNSIICVPIYIGTNVCGVLELINRSDGNAFTERDMTLLEIFAGYTSLTLQNALDAKRAHELARRDDLTGLYNDRWFHVRLTETIELSDVGGVPASLIFMDLDNFKCVNDRHGHLAGSQVLREVGFVLKRTVGHAGAVVSRYGGDEFVIILPAAGAETGMAVAERIRSAIAEKSFIEADYGFGLPPLHLSGLVTASVGLAVYDPRSAAAADSNDVKKNDILRRADAAMYEAKAGGKNRVVLDREAPKPAAPSL